MTTEITKKYEEMPMPIVHVVFPSKSVSKYTYKPLHSILEDFERDGYSYIVQNGGNEYYVFLEVRNLLK